MKETEHRPLDELASCRDVPDYHVPDQQAFQPEFGAGHRLDDRFIIEDVIGRSGMGTVYRARDARDEDRTVAVKVPHLQYESDPAFYSRFQREEEIGLALNHPFLLRFIAVEGRKSRPYLVTEYLSGCTLAHLLNALRPLPEKDSLKIASLVCDALQHMHEHKVVHRDLKPGNIMICRDGTLRLMDFGIARGGASRKITIGPLMPSMGTPDYMSPEQVAGKRVDARSDIYSLGAILYEMLTGVLPFQNENPLVAMNARVTGDPVAPRKLNPQLTPQAEEIVLHALQRDPGARYQTGAEFEAELEHSKQVFVSGYCNQLQEPTWKPGFRHNFLLVGLLVALGFISLQAVAFWVLRHHLGTK